VHISFNESLLGGRARGPSLSEKGSPVSGGDKHLARDGAECRI